MGVIRAVLVTFISILLFLTFFSMNTFLTMSMSLDYDVVQPELTGAITNLVTDNIDLSPIDDNLPMLAVYCQNASEIPLSGLFENLSGAELGNTELNFGNIEGFESYSIPCDMLTQGSEAMVSHIVAERVYDDYYREYDCDFWDCAIVTGSPSFLVSEKARNYWNGWFYWSLLASVILAAVLLLVMENRNNWPFLIGILLIVSVLPFLGIGWLLTLLAGWEYAQIFTLFFTQSFVTFLFGIVAGILLIGIGVVLKFLNFGQKISGWFDFRKKGSSDSGSKPSKETSKKSSSSK